MNPAFDFHQPWVALIQLALTYFLPRLTGLVTDKLAASSVKITVLGVLSVVSSALVYLLAIATANSWSTLDWVALLNIVVNAALTFAIAQGVFKGVVQPLGQDKKDADNGLNLFAPATAANPPEPTKTVGTKTTKSATAAKKSS